MRKNIDTLLHAYEYNEVIRVGEKRRRERGERERERERDGERYIES